MINNKFRMVAASLGKGRCDEEGRSRGFKYIDNGLFLSQLLGTQGYFPLFPVPLCGWNISFKNKRGMIPRFGSWARGRNLMLSAPLGSRQSQGRGSMFKWACREGQDGQLALCRGAGEVDLGEAHLGPHLVMGQEAWL